MTVILSAAKNLIYAPLARSPEAQQKKACPVWKQTYVSRKKSSPFPRREGGQGVRPAPRRGLGPRRMRHFAPQVILSRLVDAYPHRLPDLDAGVALHENHAVHLRRLPVI